jgi:paraquat-inducible protein B
MSRRANPTVIGAFVVGAVVLVVISVLLLARGNPFAAQPTYAMFFQGSVYGLQVGAPVIFRGVRVGTVTGIRLDIGPGENLEIPVTVETNPRNIRFIGPEEGQSVSIQKLIQRGLRAQLSLQSLLTGQLYVDLDFHPGKPAVFRAGRPGVHEIPTIESPREVLAQRLENFPVDKLAAAVENMNKLLVSLQDQVGPLSKEAQGTFADARDTLGSARRMLESANGAAIAARGAMGNIEHITGRDSELLRNANSALQQLAEAARSARDLTSSRSAVIYNLNDTLTEIRRAARSLRTLADTMERHPESVIWGRKPEKGK